MKYKSKSRTTVLVYIDGQVKQIRYGEVIEVREPVNLPYLSRIYPEQEEDENNDPDESQGPILFYVHEEDEAVFDEEE